MIAALREKKVDDGQLNGRQFATELQINAMPHH